MTDGTIGFIHDLRFGDIPGGIIDLAPVCIGDLVAAAGGFHGPARRAGLEETINALVRADATVGAFLDAAP